MEALAEHDFSELPLCAFTRATPDAAAVAACGTDGDETLSRRIQPMTRRHISVYDRRVRAIKRQHQDGS